VENTAEVVNDEVRRDNRPALPAEAQRRLKTLLDLHAAFIMSTPAGRALVEGAADYRLPRARNDELREATSRIADAVAQAPALFAESAASAVREAAAGLATGPHPERSTWASLLTFRGLLVGVGATLAAVSAETLLSLVTGAVTASTPGALIVQSGGAAISAAWQFMLLNTAQLQILAMALGSEARWLTQVIHIFDWIRREAKS
jgi:hypothetical protein